MNITLNGNSLTIVFKEWKDVVAFVAENSNRQVTICPDGDEYSVSSPLSKEDRVIWADLYEQQGRDPLEEFTPRPLPTGPKKGPNGPKPTGPRGGGPSGTPGAGRQVEYTFTEARAA